MKTLTILISLLILSSCGMSRLTVEEQTKRNEIDFEINKLWNEYQYKVDSLYIEYYKIK